MKDFTVKTYTGPALEKMRSREKRNIDSLIRKANGERTLLADILIAVAGLAWFFGLVWAVAMAID